MDSLPLCMSYKFNHLWIGGANVDLYDGSNKEFNHVETFNLGHSSKITGIQFTLGSLITCSKDRTLKISEPNLHSN